MDVMWIGRHKNMNMSRYRLWVAILAVCLVGGLAACSGSSSESLEETEKSAEGSEEETEKTADTEVTQDSSEETEEAADLYAELLSFFCGGISEQWSSYAGEVMTYDVNYDANFVYGIPVEWDEESTAALSNSAAYELSYMWAEYNIAETLSDAGYAMLDLNEDGSDELVITTAGSDGSVMDLYTSANGEIVHLFSGWERGEFMLYEGGIIGFVGSSGALNTYYCYYMLEDDSLVLSEAVVYDEELDEENPWFYSTLGTQVEDLTAVSEEEALAVIESFEPLAYELTLLSE